MNKLSTGVQRGILIISITVGTILPNYLSYPPNFKKIFVKWCVWTTVVIILAISTLCLFDRYNKNKAKN